VILSPASRRVLIVDDDAAVLKASVALLDRAGFEVDGASSGESAAAMLARQSYSAILSDINMTGMSGLDLLRTIRERDLDTPVVLFTGGASLNTALDAMAWGAHRYLLKPVSPPELIEVVTRAVLLSDLARLKREVFALRGTHGMALDNEAEVQRTFSRALERIAMVYHPIISVRQGRTMGFEALVRCQEPSLSSPETLLATAALLGRQEELTHAIYAAVAAQAHQLPEGRLLFVNVHPPDLLHPSLHGLGSPLAPFADRIVLEITERASLEKLGNIRALVSDLRLLKYRLAVDDLGTGYAGLASFTQLSPDFVKLDRSLVCGIDQDATKQRVVRAMTLLCADLGMQVIAEGIETREERETLEGLGADLLQGWLFGKPSAEFAEPVI
jgi:EAL domain-containing protein (putative c-di-GMP-specific phosphodiesterase class I)/CheY-like chemotaxis protein